MKSTLIPNTHKNLVHQREDLLGQLYTSFYANQILEYGVNFQCYINNNLKYV